MSKRAGLSVAAAVGLLWAHEGNAQNLMGLPLFGTASLTTGFVPDPTWVEVLAGGDADVAALGIVDPTGEPCRGYIGAAQPDFRIDFSAGTTFPLKLYVQSQADTTLIVNLPDSTWRCSDDVVAFQPAIELAFGSVQSGQYDVWVGTYAPGAPQSASLHVTELSSNGPTP